MSEGVLIALIGTIGVIVNTIITLIVNSRVRQYHEQVNGHMGKLLELTKKDGVQEGKDKQIAKQNKK